MDNQKVSSQMLTELIGFLKSRGVAEEEIQKVADDVTAAASGKLYAEFMVGLPEEELKKLDEITDQEQANAKIREVVQEKTGKSMDQILVQYTDAIAEEVYKTARLKYPPNSA